MILLFLLALLGNVYEATIVRVIDGDTVVVRVGIWTDQELTTSIRMRQIDTPELKGKCEFERDLAQKAKAFTLQLLPVGSKVMLSNIQVDKFGGRYDADLRFSDGKLVSAVIIGAGLARPYAGGKRAGWC